MAEQNRVDNASVLASIATSFQVALYDGQTIDPFFYYFAVKLIHGIREGKLFIKALEKNPSIISKARYALGLKKIKPSNVKKCSAAYWEEIITALGKYCKLPKEKIEKAKRSKIYY